MEAMNHDVQHCIDVAHVCFESITRKHITYIMSSETMLIVKKMVKLLKEAIIS